MKKNILLIVSGSIGAYKAATFASRATQLGFIVRTVLTRSASQFVGSPTFEGLTRQPVYIDLFEKGQTMSHIDLARWADLTLVYPATASRINQMAAGIGEDLAGTLFLAHDFKTPIWIAPAMNPAMVRHPAYQRSIEQLVRWGIRVFDTDYGRMACGEVGEGRLIEPEKLLEEVREYFTHAKDRAAKPMKVLVTAGGTQEKIDPVRVLSNTSTGETGVRIARRLRESGQDVTLLLSSHSPFRKEVGPGIETVFFNDFSDLDRALKEELSSHPYDWIVHAAAVSDYSIARIENSNGERLDPESKISSSNEITLRLKPNPKLLDRVREYSRYPIQVFSFKLSTKPEVDLSGYSSDWILFNTVEGIDRETGRHEGRLYKRSGDSYEPVSSFTSKEEMLSEVAQTVVGSRIRSSPLNGIPRREQENDLST